MNMMDRNIRQKALIQGEGLPEEIDHFDTGRVSNPTIERDEITIYLTNCMLTDAHPLNWLASEGFVAFDGVLVLKGVTSCERTVETLVNPGDPFDNSSTVVRVIDIQNPNAVTPAPKLMRWETTRSDDITTVDWLVQYTSAELRIMSSPEWRK